VRKSLSIALCQMMNTSSKTGNLSRAAQMIQSSASHKDIDLVILPEVFNAPYQPDLFPDYAEYYPGPTTEFLAHIAMNAGKEVTWVPSYGAEMRGGTANCLVTISEEEISSPLTENPMTAIIMNRPSLDKYESRIKANGTLVINSSMVDRLPEREDLNVLQMPVNQIAAEIGNSKGANMIILGAYLEKTGLIEVEEALDYFGVVFKGKNEKVIEENKAAFMAGVEYARRQW
jgi:2-oxoglutarate ferredoxin oxidoreductase subunit gamma